MLSGDLPLDLIVRIATKQLNRSSQRGSEAGRGTCTGFRPEGFTRHLTSLTNLTLTADLWGGKTRRRLIFRHGTIGWCCCRRLKGELRTGEKSPHPCPLPRERESVRQSLCASEAFAMNCKQKQRKETRKVKVTC